MKSVSKEDKIFLKNLGQRIAEIRKERGMTQVDLGFKCDMEKPNMNRIEKGNTNPNILILRKIFKELDIDLEDILKKLK